MADTAAPSPLNDEILCHTGGFAVTNGFAWLGKEGWIGVDAPFGFAQFLTARGIQLKALLLTHAHFDHVEDAAQIAGDHGCPIYAFEISTPETRLEPFLKMAGLDLSIDPYPVNVPLKGVTEISVAGETLRVEPLPGHSLDSVIFIDEQRGRIFSGDTLMEGTMGRTDFPGGSSAMLLEGIRSKILSQSNATQIFPGHGDSTTVGAERSWVETFRG
jgi:hydroxyacylglutathione hydrolase